MYNEKRLFFSLMASILMICAGCKKSYKILDTDRCSLIESAKNYFTKEVSNSPNIFHVNSDSSTNKDKPNPRKTLSKAPVWEKAYTTQTSAGEAVVVPIHFSKPFLIKSNFGGNKMYSIDDLTKLVIYKDGSGKRHAEVVTLFPDSSYVNKKTHLFSGISFVEDWFGYPLNKYKHLPNGKIKKYSTNNKGKETSSDKTESKTASSKSIQICYEICGYNYSVNDPDNGYYWCEFAGCSLYFFDDEEPRSYFVTGDDYGSMGGGGGGIGSGGENPGIGIADVVTVEPGTGVIGNIKDYTKCFDNIPGSDHTYQVSVCVSQPNPGARDPWTFNGGGGSSNTGNPFFVGHTFLTLNETTPSKNIVRNVGFYPAGRVNPYAPSASGSLNNDESHDYNISLTVNLTSSEFTSLLNYIEQVNTSSFMYNLNTYNCTTFAINALSNIGVNLPRTTGSWLNGSGLNPGDLGEDIRKMQLSPNMTRSTAEKSHLNKGTCY